MVLPRMGAHASGSGLVPTVVAGERRSHTGTNPPVASVIEAVKSLRGAVLSRRQGPCPWGDTFVATDSIASRLKENLRLKEVYRAAVYTGLSDYNCWVARALLGWGKPALASCQSGHCLVALRRVHSSLP